MSDRNMEIAQTIFLQLGGGRFQLMTGAKNLLAVKNGLRFRIPKAKNGINCVSIILTPEDLYDVTYLRIRGTKVTEVAKDEGIYNDMLRECFERATGLYTSL